MHYHHLLFLIIYFRIENPRKSEMLTFNFSISSIITGPPTILNLYGNWMIPDMGPHNRLVPDVAICVYVSQKWGHTAPSHFFCLLPYYKVDYFELSHDITRHWSAQRFCLFSTSDHMTEKWGEKSEYCETLMLVYKTLTDDVRQETERPIIKLLSGAVIQLKIPT